jgi:ribonuclease VapC
MNRAIVVDTSVIAAICFEEPGFERYLNFLAHCETLWMAAPSRLELGIVSTTRGVSHRAAQILENHAVEVIAFDETMALAAIGAFDRYGKGRHPAGLNFGDCCSYALAKTRRIPLLYKGDDFALTDIPSAFGVSSQ